MNKRLAGEMVTIATDPSADRRGSYGRLLVYVDHNGENVNLQLIEQGYARLYDTDFSERNAFASAERTAQNNEVGLWGYEKPAPSTPEATEAPADPTEQPADDYYHSTSIAQKPWPAVMSSNYPTRSLTISNHYEVPLVVDVPPR